MNADESIVFLTKAALLDPRMKRVDPVEYADMAIAWAEVLDDVALQAALTALRDHYRGSSETITPARVLELCPTPPAPVLPDITGELLAEDMQQQLAAANVTEAEWRAHARDAAWLTAHFPQRELEASRD